MEEKNIEGHGQIAVENGLPKTFKRFRTEKQMMEHTSCLLKNS